MMPDSAYPTLLVDFDGTLVDTEPLHYEANNDAFERFGHSINLEEYYRYWSSMGHGARGEIDRHGLVHIDETVVKKISRERFLELIRSRPVPLIPGASRLFEIIRDRHIRAAIASNTPPEFLSIMIRRSGLDCGTTPVIGGSEDLRGKPFPDILIQAMDLLQVSPAQTLVIEDTLKGLRASLAAGCPCVIIPSGRYPLLDYSGAHSVFGSLDECIDSLII